MLPSPPPSATLEPPRATEAAPVGILSSWAPAVPTRSSPPAQAAFAPKSRRSGNASFVTRSFMRFTLRPMEGIDSRAMVVPARLEVVEPLLLDEDRDPVHLRADPFDFDLIDIDPARDGEVALRVQIPRELGHRGLVRGGRFAPDPPNEVP